GVSVGRRRWRSRFEPIFDIHTPPSPTPDAGDPERLTEQQRSDRAPGAADVVERAESRERFRTALVQRALNLSRLVAAAGTAQKCESHQQESAQYDRADRTTVSMRSCCCGAQRLSLLALCQQAVAPV